MLRSLKAIGTVLLIMAFAMGCNKPDEPDPIPDPVLHEYVDLGLPSGILWATCNVGADLPEEYGDFFAWGETEPKDVYDWASYKYGDFVNEKYDFVKYCSDSVFGLNGFVDTLTSLEPVDDAATALWGQDWRTPTIDEWKELFIETTGAWAVQNGVEGWLLTAMNGNSLFLPAAGYWWESAFNSSLGLYWSSTINTEFPNRAWGFHFNTDSAHLCGSSDRNRGQAVRAVRVAREL